MARRTINVGYLARVEGEGALHLTIRDDRVDKVELRIFEPPRFFEAFLRGRHFSEAPDITSRICGICPVAYQMSAVHAMEAALGINVDGQLRALRRLLYCGEWIESHTLHIYMLHAPDFLGYESAIDMARDHRAIVERGLQLKKAGNEIMRLLGGREIHPINVRVGGFYRTPQKRELLVQCRACAVASVAWPHRSTSTSGVNHAAPSRRRRCRAPDGRRRFPRDSFPPRSAASRPLLARMPRRAGRRRQGCPRTAGR